MSQQMTKPSRYERDLTEGSVVKQLILFALPFLASNHRFSSGFPTSEEEPSPVSGARAFRVTQILLSN